MYIIGMGTALPENEVAQSLTQLQASRVCGHTKKQERVLAQMYKKTEISSRAFVLASAELDPDSDFRSEFFQKCEGDDSAGPGTEQRMKKYASEAGSLAAISSAKALQNAGFLPTDITHLVTVSCTGFGAPGFDLHLVKTLGLEPSVYRTHIGFMGCHGALNALRVAEGFCSSQKSARVLLNATELCSLHFQYAWESNNLVANSLFADGSASLVLGPARNTASFKTPQYVSSKSFVIPNTESIMTWQITNNGFKMVLGSELPQLIEQYLDNFVCEWLKENSLSKRQISGWAVHPGGPKILHSVEKALGLSSDHLESSRRILARCGNMSSPTVLFIMEELLQKQITTPYVVLGFGPGLTIEAALFI